MPESNFFSRFGSRVIDGLLPGTQRNPETGQLQNVGRGALALVPKIAASFFGGPMAGMAVGKLAGRAVDSGFLRGSQSQAPYSFYSMGANPMQQFGSSPFSYQMPAGPSQASPFSPQQPFWSYQQGQYQQPSGKPTFGGGGGGGGDLGFGGGGSGPGESGGCVTVDSYVVSGRGVIRAGEVVVGDKLRVVDPATFEHSWATVSHSETMPQPCVTIRAGDVELDCSESAPIGNADGEQILAPNTDGQLLPLVVDGKDDIQIGGPPKSIGTQQVQKITCESKFFLAGKVAGRYLLHHNVKSSGGGGPIASYNYMPNWAGLKWGW